MDPVLFLIFAIVAVVCGILVVVQTHPISSALALIGVMASLAVIYLLLGAQFIAAAQVIVYAGAIMVLFLFVIMLLNAGREEKSEGSVLARVAGVPLLVALLALVSYVVYRMFPSSIRVAFGEYTGGTVENLGRALFTTYLWPFEITSVLVLIAIVGAVVLAYRELD
ncbi:MAG TPA: NADH-quinone oxidoreductase subunit J [Bryobacteraceae bacterium]|nr:NADH-quinone oxidoreductase subunit J [Bryobacteraceae bacterium]